MLVTAIEWTNMDPAVGKFLEFRVHALPPGAVDTSMNPADYVPGGLHDDPADHQFYSGRRYSCGAC